MMVSLNAFHFLRPEALLALIIVGLFWYQIRPRKFATGIESSHIAPHLLDALRVGSAEARKFYPIDGVAICLSLLVLAAAGPTWSRLPNPLIAETAPLVVALKVTPSMETPDLAPSRLDRGRFKALDLVAARAGARTALIAYAGSAHRVSPLTEDPNILRPLLEGLSSKIMPVKGDAADKALALGQTILAEAETPGAMLFVLDDLDPQNLPAFDNPDPENPLPPIVMLLAVPDNVKLPQIDGLSNVTVVRITPDESDLDTIQRRLESAHQAAMLKDERLSWDDRGWWFVWPAALLALLWFRRGWSMHWAIAVLALTTLATPQSARAEGMIDWFFTPDQQGRMAYDEKEYGEAAELFQDPMWHGYALMRAGKYADAAEALSHIETPEAAFAEGYARIRNREYREGARSYEKALLRDPEFPNAQRNADIAWAIVEYVESTREQSDTGEESGVGADDVVFDNEEARGQDTQVEREATTDKAPLTAQQWIDSIDTDMSDFLHARFLLENVEAQK